MQLGMVGLGRMGANLVRRLMRDGHECVVFDVDADAVRRLEGEGATGAASLEDFVSRLTAPRAAWVMVPAGFTGATVEQLAELMQPDDVIIDGGNSNYRDDIARSFTRADGIERLWAVCAGVLDDPPPVEAYPQGSWGPQAAQEMVSWTLR